MIRNIFLLIFFISIYLFFSCKNQRENSGNDDFTLSETEIITIPIDNKSKNFHQQLGTFFLNNKECFYFTESDRLVFIDISTKKVIKTIFFQKEGPNGIKELQSAYVHRLDSIIVKGYNPYVVYVSDSLGNIIKRIPFPEDSEMAIRGCYFIGNNKPIYIADRIVGFLHPTLRTTARMMELKSSPFFEISKKDDSIKLVVTLFPNFFWEERKRWQFVHFIPGVTSNNNKMIISYPACDSIYTIEFGSDVISKSHFAKSRYKLKDPNPIPLSTSDIKDVYKEECEAYEYKYIIYDKYRNVYYRFLLHPIEYNTNRYNLLKILLDKSFSIQILDKDFKTIGYKELPERKFCVMDYFVGKKGLYISNNNPENLDTNENTLKYSLFEFVKK